jgi:hypothetical protein
MSLQVAFVAHVEEQSSAWREWLWDLSQRLPTLKTKPLI